MLLSAQLQSLSSVLQEGIWLVINYHNMLDQCKVNAVSLMTVPAVKPHVTVATKHYYYIRFLPFSGVGT